MRAYLALIKIDVKLALRDRSVIFFNYLFPLIFFFVFAEMMGATRGGGITNIVTMVLVIGILGNGLWGAGMRTVQEREMNILRRFKITPISPSPILIASIVTGWLIYLPAVVLVCALAHFVYGMPVPQRWPSLVALVTLGVFAFRSIGLILASIVNSAQESTIGIQLLYMPMLFLSGATFPSTLLPHWAQIVGQFLPATYLVTGFQSVFLRKETLAQNGAAVAALLITMALATFISIQIFRWEKGEKLRPAAKLWLLAVLSPFVAMGCYQAYSKEHSKKAEMLWRELMRTRQFVIRGARIFVGPGKVIESGAVLVKNGQIELVGSDSGKTKVETIDGSGKTLLPGLIDVHVQLDSIGQQLSSERRTVPTPQRALTAYLSSGVTAVNTAGGSVKVSLSHRTLISSGRALGAEVFVCGPIFNASEQSSSQPGIPKTPLEAREQVRALKQAGVDGGKVNLQPLPRMPLSSRTPRLEPTIFKAIAEEAHAHNLPLVIQTAYAADIAEALKAGAAGIEQGSVNEEIPDRLFARMVQAGLVYDPVLSIVEPIEGKQQFLSHSLSLQVGPKSLIDSAWQVVGGVSRAERKRLDVARSNLLRAWRAGVMLVTGRGAGYPLVLHGPTVQHELEPWAEAGIPPEVGLGAATENAARLLPAENRIGSIYPGKETNLLLVDGDPLHDISTTERISLVVFKGERIKRASLFDQR